MMRSYLFAAAAVMALAIPVAVPAQAAYDAACVKAVRDELNAVVMPALQAAIAGSITWAEYMAIYWEASAEARAALGDCW